MSESRRGERLFRTWASATPAYDGDAGRARFLQAFRSARKGRGHGARVSFATALAMAAAVAACCWAVAAFRTATTLRFATSLGEGHAGAWLATGAANEMPLTFSEGTRVVMGPDSRGRVEQLGRAGATFLLERGQVRAHVVHRSNTSWRFCAGPFEVQVTGTTLSVEWIPRPTASRCRSTRVRSRSTGRTTARFTWCARANGTRWTCRLAPCVYRRTVTSRKPTPATPRETQAMRATIPCARR